MEIQKIVDDISKSKKYRAIDKKFINEIAISLSYKYKENELVDNVKSKLHQVWGAYYSTRPNFNKLISKFKSSELSLNQLLLIHQSTKERVGEYDDIFKYIFENTKHDSIIDIGCGFNPLFITNLPGYTSYLGVDIDIEQQDFLSEILKSDTRIKLEVGSSTFKFENKDLVLALKLLPVLDMIELGYSMKFLSNLDCKYLVVSFPNKSISGKNKGMIDNYNKLYIPQIQENGFKLLSSKEFNKETVYIFNH